MISEAPARIPVSAARSTPTVMRITFVCKYCNERFRKAQLLIYHKKQRHPVEVHEILMKRESQLKMLKEAGETEEPRRNSFNNRLQKAKGQINELKCRFCPKTFVYPSKRRNHEQKHSKIRPHQCKHCRSSFSWKENLTTHERRWHGQSKGPRSNTKVNSASVSRPRLRHSSGSGSTKLLSRLVPVPSSSKSQGIKGGRVRSTIMSPHITRLKIDNSSVYQCNFCQKLISNKCVATIHARVHTGDKPFKCSQCKENFISKASLKKHKLRKHNDVLTKSESETEEQQFAPETKIKIETPSRISVKREMQKKSKIKKKSSRCVASKAGIEASSFTDTEKATVTKVTQKNGKYYYNCSLCPKIFFTKPSAYDHIWKHKGQKPYNCSQCSRSFTVSQTLKDHEAGHHRGEMKHLCKYCSKAFVWYSYKNKHERSCTSNDN